MFSNAQSSGLKSVMESPAKPEQPQNTLTLQMDEFLNLTRAECVMAINRHGEFNSLHEAFAVLYEEVDELWEEVRRKRGIREPRRIRTELVQIAAMAMKTALKFGRDQIDEPLPGVDSSIRAMDQAAAKQG